MDYETTIGLRYLRSKRKDAFISLTTWISVLGIAIGVMALILVIAVMTGFQDEIKERILGINPHILIMDLDKDIKDPDSIVNQLKDIKDVTHAYPFVTFQAMIQGGNQMTGAMVKGVNGKDIGFLEKLLRDGSIGNLEKKGNVLIGKEMAKHLGLISGDPLSIIIPFGGISPMGVIPETVRVKVGGIFETGMYEIDNTMVIMSLKDVEGLIGPGVTGIEVKLKDVYRAEEVRREAIRRLGHRYFGRTWIEMNRNLFSALKLEKIAMFIILALVILVASFNIVSSLVMTVKEKKKDIAILKAMGAKKRGIMKIFIVEGLVIGVTGASIGSFGGYLLCEIQRRFQIISLAQDVYYITNLPMKVSLLDVILIASTTLLLTILSTLYPSFKAANIDPVETLRYE
ncbi:MAG: lipoprotein-releasing ABC transporter permease subunit [Syntrophorhabdaceae bacterium]|nr:lipoprotein-releasing ABC transporter permease subunit [Syntrophorhabdaceae bacterium]